MHVTFKRNPCTGGPRYMQTFYLRFRVYAIQKWPFYGTNPLINSHPWSFYMRIHYMRVYFWSPYLLHITWAACIRKIDLVYSCSIQYKVM